MKKELSPEKIRQEYVDHLLIIEKANLDGDYRLGNKEGKYVIKLFKFLENNEDLAKEVLLPLLFHQSTKVRICAAAHFLALKLNVVEALNTLERIAEQNIKIFSLEAEMTVRVWHEQGYLRIYQK